MEKKGVNSTFSPSGAMFTPVTNDLVFFEWESKTVESGLLKAILIWKCFQLYISCIFMWKSYRGMKKKFKADSEYQF